MDNPLPVPRRNLMPTLAKARKSLSILLVYDCVYPESIGGVEHRNHEVAKALAKRGHSVTIRGWTSAPREVNDRVRVLGMPFAAPIYGANGKRSAVTSLRYAFACLFLSLREFDVVETANIPYIHLFPLAFRCLIARKRLIVTWHECWGKYWRYYVGRLRAPIYAAIERLAAQFGTQVVAVSGLTAGRVRESRRKATQISVIPCGLDLERIRSVAGGVVRRPYSLVYAGRLISDKRLSLVIRAIALLAAKRIPARLVVIGEGPERAALEALSARLQVDPQVDFMGHLRSPEDVWREISGARIAVTASSREGFGMFPLEAMACGTPVVYCESSESALPEILGDGRCGLRAAATAESLAEVIRVLLQDQNLWTTLSANATADAERYRWDAIAEKTENILYA